MFTDSMILSLFLLNVWDPSLTLQDDRALWGNIGGEISGDSLKYYSIRKGNL
jgi:hypothetical protein